MIVAPLLLGYAAVLCTVIPRWLGAASWPDRAPRLAMVAWFSLATSALSAVMLAGAVLVIPASSLGHDLAVFARICAQELESHYGVMGGCAVGALGIGVLIAVPLRAAFAAWAVIGHDRRWRRRHLRRLLLTAHRDARHDALVLDYPVAAAYCLPDRGGLIVVTSAALTDVPAGQLESVLSHERAHLRGRHHQLVTVAEIARRAFGRAALFGQLPGRIGTLVELRADDVAASRLPSRTVAEALLAFAEHANRAVIPAPALAATGASAVHRMDRLLRDNPRLSGVGVGGVLTGSALVLLAPTLVAVWGFTRVYQVCCA